MKKTHLESGWKIQTMKFCLFGKMARIYQLKVLKETGRYDAFKLKWHPSYSDKPDVWPVLNHLFWDSDVAKWIEGRVISSSGRNMMRLTLQWRSW